VGVSIAFARRRLPQQPPALAALAAAVAALVLLPPVYLIWRASESNAIWDQLADESTLRAIGRTVLLTVSVTATCIALAVPLAWLTGRTDLPLRRFWTVLLALPLAVPTFVGGFVAVSALGPGGLLQDLLEPLGVERLPSIYGFWGAWFVISIFSYPYVFIPVRAALARIDPSIEEVSRSLGKGAWETFRRVNLPQLRPAIAAGALLVALYVVSEFGAVSMLRYDTLTPLIGLAVLILVIESLGRGRAKYYSSAQRRPARTQTLGRWRWPAVAFCGLVAALGLGLPVAVILYWLVRGLGDEGTTGFVLDAAANSTRASAMAAVAAALACLPVAYLSARHPGTLSGLFEKASYAGQSLPAITIALALVFFAANYITGLYQTIWILVFAYSVRFLPEAMGAIRSSLLQVNPHTEEAARSLGSGPVRTFARVTAPQTFPGISAGMLLVFLTAMKELPITILLSPIGFDTLATEIWNATSEAFFAKAAMPSLILLLISACAVMLMLRRERLS
jgi:iron(III) transport system permease protein